MAKLNFIHILMWLFGIVIVGKIIYYQVFYDKDQIAKELEITIKVDSILPTRGDIYSYDGKLIATSVAQYIVGMDLNCEALTQEIFDKSVDSLALCLSQVFPEKTKEQFKKELIQKRDSGSRYYRFSNKKVNHMDFKKISDFPILRKGRIKGGFVYDKTYSRNKPCGLLASRTIGSLNEHGVGNVGLERAYDSILGGKIGYTVKERISGNMWMPIENAQSVKPINGMDLISTIDIGLQDVAETSLEKQLKKHNALYGTVVVMEVETGKVRAIANLKRNPNGNYYETFNHAIGDASDPGSTFKLASVIVAMEDGYVTPEQMIETGDGITYYYRKAMRDTKKGGYGTISLKEAFELSSNVGISKIINQNYKDQPQKFIDGLYKLHLNEPLGVVIQKEAEPKIRRPGDTLWSGLTLTQMSIGYEVNVSPLQVLAFYNAIANNGTLIKPIFAEAISYRGKVHKTFEPEIIDEQICSQKTINEMKLMLEGVVENGTAKNLKNPNYKIAGKTGTAQMDYDNDSLGLSYHASFAGYFPADLPKYSCIVSIYKARDKGYYGSAVAGPVFKEIADRIYATNSEFFYEDLIPKSNSIPTAKKGNKNEIEKVYAWLNIDTNNEKLGENEWVDPKVNDKYVQYKPVNFSDKTKIPNVIGMGAKDATIILERAGLNVRITGRGRVASQKPSHGNHFKQGDNIEIILR
jgi:cell division protein FtsI (penicillin-binding protein 3)